MYHIGGEFVRCECYLCVFHKDEECILDEVGVDALGMCGSCEIVSVPREEMEKVKARRLKVLFGGDE